MRKVMLMVALAWASAALAQNDTAQQTKEAGHSAASDVQHGAGQARDWSKEQANKAGQQADAARDRMKKDDFDIQGKVAKASKSELSLQRKDAPAATLHIDKTTKVEVDGQQASAAELKPGQDVKASFNLKGDKPVAVEIKAEKQK